jgi:hypothetical protein
MTWTFSGDPRQLMSETLVDLHTASEDRPDADGYFHRAMMSLVGLYDRQAECGAVHPEEMAAFRRESGDAMLRLDRRIPVYLSSTLGRAETAEEGDWYQLAMRRSVIQSLLDDYAGTRVAQLVEEDPDLSELDDELRRVAEEQDPVPEHIIPRGIPNSHWWWHLPAEHVNADGGDDT